MTNVYAWPPFGVRGSEWTYTQPVSVSRSMMTGARVVSQFQAERRLVRLDVSALGQGRLGAGYMEVLKRLLAGGVGLVRLNSYPINWYIDGGASGDFWFTGALIEGTPGTADGWDIVTVTGLPASRLVARPGDFLTVFEDVDDTVGTTVMIQALAYSDGTGEAVIRVVEAIPFTGRVNLGGSDTGVFEATTIPRAMQQVGSDWTYSWEFREVFADEVPGGFTEVDPWN